MPRCGPIRTGIERGVTDIAMDEQGRPKGMKKAMRNAVLLGLLALLFYVGIFFLVKWRHP